MATVAHRQAGGQQASGSRYHEPGRSQGASSSSAVKKRTSSSGGEKSAKLGPWKLGRTIGKGSSGRVKIAKHEVTGKIAAIKIVPKGVLCASRMSMNEAGARADKIMLGIEREIVIMKLIDHPNVLSLFDVWETKTELYLIMEYVPGGELFDYLVKRGRLPITEALHYFQQIIFAVDYCHRFNICHRDLKPENLLLDNNKNIKVADFGMAAWEAGEKMLETSCGSPHYASPEIVAGKAYHGSASDIWSCGIILFALLTGRLPFDDDNIRSLLQKVKVGVFEMPDEIQNPARDLLKRMLEKDPERRITMPEILRHPFFVQKPPKPIPGRKDFVQPSLDDVARPIQNPEEIDADIMGNLKTLWSGASEDEIIAALMSTEKTWEKTIYHLLMKYRDDHWENYNMDDDMISEARTPPARRREKTQVPGQGSAPPLPSPSPRKTVQPSPRSPRSPRGRRPLGENNTIQEQVTSPIRRPAAPTPKKAASGGLVDMSPVVRKDTKSAPPKGPRPPGSPAHNKTMELPPVPAQELTPDKENQPPTPSIVLHQPTPTKDMPPPSIFPVRLPDPPSPNPPASPILAPSSTPSPGPLNVPTVQDEKLQHFFNEVANQLNTMNIRSSVASTSTTSSTPALGNDYQAYLAYAQGLPGPSSNAPSVRSAQSAQSSPTGPPMRSPTDTDPNQFADADGDDTEMAASEYSHATHGGSTPLPSPLVGLGFGQPPTRPGLLPIQTGASQYSYSSGGPPSPYLTASPMSGQSAFSPRSPISPRPGSTITTLRKAPPPPQATRPAPPRPVSAYRTESSALYRDQSYVVIDTVPAPTATMDNSWGSRTSEMSTIKGSQDGFGMLKKRKKGLTIDAVPFTPDFGGGLHPNSYSPSMASSMSGPSPKRSWFNNLFSFKAPSCTLLSIDNISNTRDRSKKILTELGVRVAVAEIDGIRALKCRLDEIRDIQGSMTVVRGVRFRVEFSRSTPNPSGGYHTLVSLTLEKGAQSSFKMIFSQLRTAVEAAQALASPSLHSDNTASTPKTTYTPANPVSEPQRAVHHAKSFQSTSSNQYPSGGNTATGTMAPPMRWTSSEPNTPVVPQGLFGGSVTPGSVLLPSAMRG